MILSVPVLILVLPFVNGYASLAANDSHVLEKREQFVLPPNAVTTKWYYHKRSSTSYTGCTRGNDDKKWIMLNAYRGGGLQGWHWKFSRGPNDKYCLSDWTYYGKDGVWLMKHVKGRLTKDHKNRTWCAMPVYQRHGVRGYQWDYCTPV